MPNQSRTKSGPALNIGLIVPINNTTMERELLAWLPERTGCRTVKVPRGAGMLTPADLPAYLSRTVALAEAFVDEPVDLIVYGCTAAGFLAGPQRDQEIGVALSEVTGKPTVTTASAMTAALHQVGARNIALVTPYGDLVNERLKAFLENSNIGVRSMSGFGAANVEELAAIDAAGVAARAREAMSDDCDALFIACSQLPTRAILDELEQAFRRPAWSSIKATAWQASRTLGFSLFREPAWQPT